MIPNFRITSKSSGVPVNLDKHKEIRDISSKATRHRIDDLSGDSKKPRLDEGNFLNEYHHDSRQSAKSDESGEVARLRRLKVSYQDNMKDIDEVIELTEDQEEIVDLK